MSKSFFSKCCFFSRCGLCKTSTYGLANSSAPSRQRLCAQRMSLPDRIPNSLCFYTGLLSKKLFFLQTDLPKFPVSAEII